MLYASSSALAGSAKALRRSKQARPSNKATKHFSFIVLELDQKTKSMDWKDRRLREMAPMRSGPPPSLACLFPRRFPSKLFHLAECSKSVLPSAAPRVVLPQP